ncbi:DUF4199 family protein [Mucilaginibacter ginkgonis]|uniref:DUF4199 family protein n=1 Tax=Mucilaginibacter ginkgonis TaxID=2682091 RepID=A0A6I4HXG4_9SPHI|nr:DUF4199 family protein [Mucilaginibacter ginkgonis]QQL51058.1 DUF4199 family protein [Mucilaginibacter ginkgonis]
MALTDAELRKQGAYQGVFVGAIILFINVLSYYVITAMSLPFWFITVGLNVLLFILYIATTASFIVSLRTKIGGYWSFKQAATAIFFLAVVAYAINYVGRDLVFARLIEKNMATKTKDAIVNANVKRLQAEHISQDSIQKSTVIINKKIAATDTTTAFQDAAGLPIILIMLFVAAIIFAAMFKKDPPQYVKIERDRTA